MTAKQKQSTPARLHMIGGGGEARRGELDDLMEWARSNGFGLRSYGRSVYRLLYPGREIDAGYIYYGEMERS